jgi:uncharacterized protein YbjT (DUF2867 family)
MTKRLLRFFGIPIVVLAFLPVLALGQAAERGSRVILVSGATGTQGGAVARELIERGYRVRGLTRSPDSAASGELTALGIEMVRGDFDDAASLDAALEGAYGAFSVQQYRGVGVDGEIRQSKSFAEAAKRAGVAHFVYTSVSKARLGTGVPQFESKRDIEDYVRALGIPYTIIRPASFMSGFEEWRQEARTGLIRGPLPADLARVFIAPSDIGRIAAEAFDQPDAWIGRELAIAGDRITYADIAAAMGRVMQRPVRYEQIPWEEYSATATPTAIARERWYMENRDPLDETALRHEFPWLLTFEQYLIEAGWGGL